MEQTPVESISLRDFGRAAGHIVRQIMKDHKPRLITLWGVPAVRLMPVSQEPEKDQNQGQGGQA